MSPEQAKGRSVDKRSDIWAFGAVFFEMLTATRAFNGEDITDTIVAVMSKEPDWATLPHDTPAPIRKLLRRCLEKDRKRRLDSASAVRLEIEDAQTAPTAHDANTTQGSVSSSRVTRLAWPIAAIAILGVALLAFPAVQHLREATPPEPTETRVDIVTPATADPASFALSPDGRQIIFQAAGDGVSRLWVRPLGSTTASPLAGTEKGGYPFWSPDSRSVGFSADGALKRLDLGGGRPVTLAPARDGGDAVPATTLATDQRNHRYPFFLPDGRHFLFFALGTSNAGAIYLGTLDSSTTTRLIDAEEAGVYLPSMPGVAPAARANGWLLWERGGALVARGLDVEKAALTGDIVTVADGIARNQATFAAALSVSGTGLIAYRSGGNARRQMTWVDRTGAKRGTMSPPDENDLRDPSVSPDGRRLAVSRQTRGNIDLWLLDGVRITRFTFDAGPDMFPVWSPDGGRIVFKSVRNGQETLFVKKASGGGQEAPLVESDEKKWPTDWSGDGRFLLYQSEGPQTSSDLWVRPMNGDTTPWIFLKTPFAERMARFSPDGRWVAYSSNESGRVEVYVRPFTPSTAETPASTPGAQWQVSTNGGVAPVWRADGTELYYEGLDGAMMATPITVRGLRIEAGAPVWQPK